MTRRVQKSANKSKFGSQGISLLLSWFAILQLTFFPMGISWAKEEKVIPAVALVGYRTGNDLPTRQFRTYLRNQMEKSKKVVFVEEKASREFIQKVLNEKEFAAKKKIEEARLALRKGKSLYQDLSIDEAIRELKSAVAGFREGWPSLRRSDAFLESYLYLGMASYVNGENTAGREWIRQGLILDAKRKSRVLSRKRFPPKIVELHETLKKNVLKGEFGEITVLVNPLDAKVYFDAVELKPDLKKKGVFKIDEIPYGEHFLVVHKDGFRPEARVVKVSRLSRNIETKLEEWQPFDSYLSFAQRNNLVSRAMLKKVGEDLGADILLLGSSEKASENRIRASAQLFDVRSEEFSRIERVQFERGKIQKNAKNMADLLLKRVSVSGWVVAEIGKRYEPRFEDRSSRLSSGGTPFYSTWWFWTAMGVAAAGGLGVILLTTKSDANFNQVTIDLQ